MYLLYPLLARSHKGELGGSAPQILCGPQIVLCQRQFVLKILYKQIWPPSKNFLPYQTLKPGYRPDPSHSPWLQVFQTMAPGWKILVSGEQVQVTYVSLPASTERHLNLVTIETARLERHQE